jgi:hypothetical protein
MGWVDGRIQISKGLLVGLVVVAAGALLGLAFLLGRQWAPAASAPRETAAPATASPYVPRDAPESTRLAEPAALPPTQPTTPAAAPQESPRSSPPVPSRDPERAAVQAYFKALDSIQAGSASNPESSALSMLSGLGKGDSGEMDAMIRQAQGARDRLAAIVPPRPCVAYHQESLAVLAEGLEQMQAVKGLFASPDPASQVAGLTGKANAMKARADRLQEQEKALRQKYSE